MASSGRRQPIRSSAAGAQAAAREHERLGTLASGHVDIFDVIERAGIWLMFQPLDSLYGAYERAGDAAGIMINAKQPPSLQRFTAAHEYGHHVLGHATSLDDVEHILPEGDIADPVENAAQSFAAYFLMPPPVVDRALERMGIDPQTQPITPHDAYLLSLDLGVSYAAAVNQLGQLGKIPREAVAKLRRYPPKRIKAEITQHERPRHDRTDVWLLRGSDAGRLLHPRMGDELYTYLPEIPSSGYLWNVEGAVVDMCAGLAGSRTAEEAALGLIADDFTLAAAKETGMRPGSGGTRRLGFKVLRSGRHRLSLAQRRPWLPAAPPAAAWAVDLLVAPQPTGSASRGLSERQKPLLSVSTP